MDDLETKYKARIKRINAGLMWKTRLPVEKLSECVDLLKAAGLRWVQPSISEGWAKQDGILYSGIEVEDSASGKFFQLATEDQCRRYAASPTAQTRDAILLENRQWIENQTPNA